MSSDRTGSPIGPMLRYYRTWQGGLAVLALLVALIGYRQYSSAVDAAWARADADTATYASALSSRAAVAIQQVRRTKATMELALEFPVPVPPQMMPLIEVAPPGGTKPAGTYWRSTQVDQVIEIFGDGQLRRQLGEPEVAATFDLTRSFVAERRSNSLLFRNIYASQTRRLTLSTSPQAESIADKAFAQMWRQDHNVTLDWIIKDVQKNVAKEFAGVATDLTWADPYLGEGFHEVQVGLLARVRSNNGAWVGTLGTTFPADVLLRMGIRQVPPLAGRYYLVTPTNSLAITDGRKLSLRSVLPPGLMHDAKAAAAAPGRAVVVGDRRMVASPVAGTPWSVLLVTDRSAARRAALPALLISAILVLLDLTALFTSLIVNRRMVFGPAIRLLEQASSDDARPMAPTTGPIWRPWAEMLDASRARSARDLKSAADQSRLTRSIVDSAIDGVITADTDGRITNFNPAAEQIFGWRRDEVLGRTMEETIVPADLRERHRIGMARHLASDQRLDASRVFELRGLHRSGREFPMQLAIAEAINDGEKTLIGYLRDLSGRKAEEAEMVEARDARHQSEKLAALGQLLAGVAHELNNPLAVVVGRAALLEEQLENSPHQASLSKLRAAANRCSRIVKTFLSMARQTGPRRGAVQVNDLVEGAVDMVAYGLRNAQIGLTTALDPAMPAIEADEDQLVQVLINLIVNAQHALESADGPRQMNLSTSYREAEQQVVIEVADNGPGVPPAVAARIFDPFFTTKDVGAGTGLGLSVSRNVIEGHGGTLELLADEGSGATFRVTLPIGGNVEAAPVAEDVAPADAASPQGTALVVDDEPELAAVLVDCLRPLGLTCLTASDGAAALGLLGTTAVDLIFCDIRMPGMDGIELLSRITVEYPALAERMAFVSGDVLHRDFDRLSLGNHPIIEKPFDPDQVREIAARFLSAKGAGR